VNTTKSMTTSASKYKPWDVVVVPFPYSDRPADKVRPAIVLSSPKLMRATGVCYLAMVTSAENAVRIGDVPVSSLRGSGLPAPSVVRPAKIMTLSESRVLKRLGALPKADQEKFMASMELFFAH